jgi:hypothetical protein
MENVYSFTSSDNEYTYNISSTIILHIKSINYAISILYFTDQMNNKINIPNDIVIYTKDDKMCTKKILRRSIQQEYRLCYIDDYIMEFNKKVILYIYR